MVCFLTREREVFHESDYCLIRVEFDKKGLSSLSGFGGTSIRDVIFSMMLRRGRTLCNYGLALS